MGRSYTVTIQSTEQSVVHFWLTENVTVSRSDEITLIGLSMYFVDPDEPDWTTHSSEGMGLGANVGPNEETVFGAALGVCAGLVDGDIDDVLEGPELGLDDGAAVGPKDGITDGCPLGLTDGTELGTYVGSNVGPVVGPLVGNHEGTVVGL
jgi:hypothetical protein